MSTTWVAFSDILRLSMRASKLATHDDCETSQVPEISRFLGIVIAIYYNDHAPPHFHARYGDYEITVEIVGGSINGKFPKRARNLVLEWLELNREALLENWELAQQRRPLRSIAPLE